MELRIKNIGINVEDDSLLKIGGYINVIERESEVLFSKKRGKWFKEVMKKGVFEKAIKQKRNIPLLVEHDWNKQIACTLNGTLNLVEDNVGLRFDAVIDDKETYDLVKMKAIDSCSFGFNVIEEEIEPIDSRLEKRYVKTIELLEVSLVENPAYTGSLAEARAYEEELRASKKAEAKEDEASKQEEVKEDETSKEDSKSNSAPNPEAKEEKPEEDKEQKEDKTKEEPKEEVKESSKEEPVKDQKPDEKEEEDKKEEGSESTESREDKPKKCRSQEGNGEDFSHPEMKTITEEATVISRQELKEIVEELIISKMQEIKNLEEQEAAANQGLQEMKEIHEEIENDYEREVCMKNNLEVVKMRLQLIKLKNLKDGI